MQILSDLNNLDRIEDGDTYKKVSSSEKTIWNNKQEKFWEGTLEEYEAIPTKDPNTYYAITDDSDMTKYQEKLVSGSNIKTINNQSILGSGNLDISGGGGSADNITTRLNSDNETEVIGIYTTQNNGRKIWEGTKAQYDAITTKDANIYYYITDDGIGYASSTQVGGLKIRLDGNTLYIRNDGTDA